MLRTLKLLDFQPKLGLITKTIGSALMDLLHFLIILVLVLTFYSIQVSKSFLLPASSAPLLTESIQQYADWNAEHSETTRM